MSLTSAETSKASQASPGVKTPPPNPRRPFETMTAGTSTTNDPAGTDRTPTNPTGGGTGG